MNYKKLEFDEVRVKMEEWKDLKPKLGNVGLPVIEMEDGRKFNQA